MEEPRWICVVNWPHRFLANTLYTSINYVKNNKNLVYLTSQIQTDITGLKVWLRHMCRRTLVLGRLTVTMLCGWPISLSM
jgi:hypothetical protein